MASTTPKFDIETQRRNVDRIYFIMEALIYDMVNHPGTTPLQAAQFIQRDVAHTIDMTKRYPAWLDNLVADEGFLSVDE